MEFHVWHVVLFRYHVCAISCNPVSNLQVGSPPVTCGTARRDSKERAIEYTLFLALPGTSCFTGTPKWHLPKQHGMVCPKEVSRNRSISWSISEPFLDHLLSNNPDPKSWTRRLKSTLFGSISGSTPIPHPEITTQIQGSGCLHLRS